MKKIISFFLVFALMLSFAACGQNRMKPTKTRPTQTTTTSMSVQSDNTTTMLPSTTTIAATTTTKKVTHNPMVSKPKSTTKKKATTTTTTTTTTATVHAHSYSKEIIAPTCTQKGYTTYTCACGDSYTADYTAVSHSYEKYVCKVCGTVDKSHAYDHLENWIKTNGTVNGSYVSIDVPSTSLSDFGLSYGANEDYIYVYYASSAGGELSTYCSITLDDYFYGFTFLERNVYGYWDADEFTFSSPITYEEYEGHESLRSDTVDLARLTVCLVIEWLEKYLADHNVGITIADLGFTAY